MIKHLKFASIPTSDQYRALAFWTEKMGFRIKTDQAMGPQRWIELGLPGAQTDIVLFTPEGQEDRIGTFFNGSFHCDDVEYTYRQLRERGVNIDAPEKQPWGTFARFRDPGRRITLTRTDKATGRAVSEEATIVAGPRPGVIVQTAAGIEALRCAGLPEKLGYAGVPAGLSSKPVLSVTTASPTAATVTVRLTYLASGFDWRASYVATLAPNGRALDLFAWMTLANGNDEEFPQAEVQAVAGRLNRVAVSAIPQEASALQLVCYPLGTTTSDLRESKFEPAEPIEPADQIVVTAMRMMAPPSPPAPAPPPPPPPPPEDLGDLKLYRIPAPTTVAARAQKQVALLAQGPVPFERRYRRPVYPGERIDAAPTAIVLVLKNETKDGLGVPLPAGSTALYTQRAGKPLLLGLGVITDRTVGETFRLAAGVSSQVTVTQVNAAPREPMLVTRAAVGSREAMLTVSNANPFAVTLDVPIGAAGQKIEAEGQDVDRMDGIVTWSPALPPGGRAELRYRY